MKELTPRKIVNELDKYIIGQDKAKKAVAIALRNRYRRMRLAKEIAEEIYPKNILMIGPTGVGKTEIARRLARLANAPFIKVEATKYTEVGYVGRDVDSMVRDLAELSVRMVRGEKIGQVQAKAERLAIDRIVDIMAPLPGQGAQAVNPLQILLGGPRTASTTTTTAAEGLLPSEREQLEERRKNLRAQLLSGELDSETIEIEVEDTQAPQVFLGVGLEEMSVNFQEMLGTMFPKRQRRKKVTVEEAKQILAFEEAQKLIDMDEVIREAIKRAEQTGIIFIDELDKIAGREKGYGPDVSREGVQRDILPIIEGTTVTSKYGPVRTDHILFIAAGAFHATKPSDLIPELQGRLPIRVNLDRLTEGDFKRILTEPENALTKQYKALLSTEGMDIEFAPDAIEEIAKISRIVNEQTEDIGARRLHTVLERLLEDLSFQAPESKEKQIIIDAQYVRSKLEDIAKDVDLSRYIL